MKTNESNLREILLRFLTWQDNKSSSDINGTEYHRTIDRYLEHLYDFRCGEGDNRCSCEKLDDCGYKYIAEELAKQGVYFADTK